MTSKQRLDCVFSGKRPDQYPVCEDLWVETEKVWRKTGAPAEVAFADFLGFDLEGAGGFDLTAQFPVEELGEDDTYKTVRDSRGVTARHHKDESGHTPHWLDMPIKKPADWWDYKKRLEYNDARIDQATFEVARKLRDKGKWIFLGAADPYEQVWPVFGQVGIFETMLDEPSVARDAMDTWGELTIKCLDAYSQGGIDIDGVWFYGDMGYRNGTLFSPEVYRTIVMPSHRAIVDFVHSKGWKAILHSCGKIKSFIPMLLEVGFDALQPLEAKCDQDVRELVREYGSSIVFFGNIDVRILATGDKERIREEVESKLAAFDGRWNYIFHSDHSVPPNITLESYLYAQKLAKDYLATH